MTATASRTSAFADTYDPRAKDALNFNCNWQEACSVATVDVHNLENGSTEYLISATYKWAEPPTSKPGSSFRCLDLVLHDKSDPDPFGIQYNESTFSSESGRTLSPQHSWTEQHREVVMVDFQSACMSYRTSSVQDLNPWPWLLRSLTKKHCISGDCLEGLALKLIIPTHDGYLSRYDFLEERMIGCQLVESTISFVTKFMQRISGFTSSMAFASGRFRSLVGAAIGAVIVKKQNPEETPGRSLDILEQAITNRLSHQWLSKSPFERKVLAQVDGRRPLNVSAAGEGIFRALNGLRYDLVVIDKPGSWLQEESSAHLRKAFLPIDMNIDESLPDRIVEAIRCSGLRIDGIITWTDRFLHPVAEAAEALELPTPPSSGIAACTDKLNTRSVTGSKDINFFGFDGQAGLDAFLNEKGRDLNFPMILKPRSGTSSDGVFKVHDIEELRAAVARCMHAKSIVGKYGAQFLLETFIEGPEVDVNFTLIDGELIFFETSDDLPSPADDDHGQSLDSFVDWGNCAPSGLPSSEQHAFKASFLPILRALGFRNGIFHLEARMRHSHMRYVRDPQTGVMDLVPTAASSHAPLPFLIEINARMPGNVSCRMVKRTYGVDYYSVYAALACGENERARSLATPFLNGSQYWSVCMRIMAERGGVWAAEDACEDMLRRVPELRPHIEYARCLFKKGMVVPDPEKDVPVPVAFFIVASRASRAESVALSEKARRNFVCAFA